MTKKLLISLLIILFSINSFSQIFIPIFLNSPQTFYCKPQNEKAVTYINRAYDFREKNINISIEYFKGAIEIDSFFCDAYYGAINSFNIICDYENALIYTDLALKNNAFNTELIKTKGRLLYKLKEYKKSSDYYQNLIELQPRNAVWYYYSSESLIKLNLLDSAKVNIIKMETIINQNYNTDLKVLSYYVQGKIAYLNHEYSKALQAFSMVEKEFKKNGEYCYYYGMTFLNQDDNNKAKKYIKRSIKYGYTEIDEETKKILGL